MKNHLEYGYYKFIILPGDRLRLTKYRGDDREVEVPARVMHYTVTEIGVGAFSFNGHIIRITLPESVEVIEPGSFAECVSLEWLNIPGKVKSLGCLTFEDCLSLETVILENSSCEIDPHAFVNSSPEIITE